MKIIMNGEIYIKKKVEPFKFKDLTILNDIKKVYNNDPDSLSSFFDKESLAEIFDVLDEMNDSRKLDYFPCTKFWYSTIEKTSIKMTEISSYGISNSRYFNCVEDLEEFFMPLHVFLNESEYIGKHFKRTEVMPDGTRFLMDENQNSKEWILYKYKDIMLVYNSNNKFVNNTVSYQYINFYPTNYYMLNPEFTLDGKYDFYGDQNKEFNDKPATYQKVFRQIYEHRMRGQ